MLTINLAPKNSKAFDFYPANEPRLNYIAPQPVDRSRPEIRLERFPASSVAALFGQIGPLANVRSSTGCGVVLRTDSPWVALHLERVRHHQLVPVGVACEVAAPDGRWYAFSSTDLRERNGSMAVRFATGLERGADLHEVVLWLPLISTCAVSGISLASGSKIAEAKAPEPRWLVIGDSLAQGFCVQSPTQNWVHRLSRRWSLPAMNLGVGGMKIESAAVSWALAAKRWDLVMIALGSNHCWNDSDAAVVEERARELAENALAGNHGRVVWCMPPYKPCEDGKGPAEFAGVALDRAAGDRIKQVRGRLRVCLSQYQPRIQIVEDLMPHDHRLLPDGIHPFAVGHGLYADNLDRALSGA